MPASMKSASADSLIRTWRPTLTNSMRRSAINRRMNRGEVLEPFGRRFDRQQSAAVLVMPPARLPKVVGRKALGASSRLVECLLPADAVGDDVQQPPRGGHVVVVARRDGFPGVAGRVGCRKPERLHEPVLAVGAVVGEGLAGPLAGDEHAASGVAEVLAAVGLALAGARPHVRLGVLGLDAVAEPVGAGRRAGFVAERVGEPVGVAHLVVGLGVVAVGDVLGEVLGQVADAAACVLGPGQDALGVEAVAEPGDVQRLVIGRRSRRAPRPRSAGLRPCRGRGRSPCPRPRRAGGRRRSAPRRWTATTPGGRSRR